MCACPQCAAVFRCQQCDAGAAGWIDAAKLPPLLTLAQVKKELKIGRTKVYAMAQLYENSGGLYGLPVIRLLNSYRVPRWAFLVLAHTGRVVNLYELAAHESTESQQLDRRGETLEKPIERDPESAHRAHSTRVRGVDRPRRSAGSRRAGSGEQLVLVPEG
jgi:hypothetical protein